LDPAWSAQWDALRRRVKVLEEEILRKAVDAG
jgi:hypothetical protein